MIKVVTDTNEYPIYFESSFENLLKAFKNAGISGRKLMVVADSNTKKIYADEIISILKKEFNEVYLFSFEAGEQSKNLDTIYNMYDYFLEKHLDRKSVVVALGGGVVGDMAGFAAATYMRGIDFVQIPTSLLSQVDSSVGGKVGVDFKGTKNIIGAFYQPRFVYINVNTAKTLPSREFAAGMAETIKYGAILDKEFLRYIEKNKEKIINLDEESLKYIIKRACEFKADVVSKDEKESGLREILNFGHTIGHAIESLFEFKLIHGECVALGMLAAVNICVQKGFVSEKEQAEFKKLLEDFILPTSMEKLGAEKIYSQMFLDKKVSNNTLNFVLLNKMGEYLRTKDVSKEEIFNAISFVEKQVF